MTDISEELIDMIDRRARRAAAVILSYKEDKADSYLPDNLVYGLRKIILDEVNELAELSIDCVKRAESESGIFNKKYLEFLEKIHDNTEVMVANLGED